MEPIVNAVLDAIMWMGYPGIVLLMALESSFFPFPSEVVMIPAGYHAFNGEMNIFAAIFCGLLGSMIGSYFNYYFSLILGRPVLIKLIDRYGRYLLVSRDKYDQAEELFRRHGSVTTFVCRFIPGVRQLISMPAGISRMNHAAFSLYTALGAGIWVSILAGLGWVAGVHQSSMKEIWSANKMTIYLSLGGFIIVVIVGYIINLKLKAKRAA